MLSTVFNSIGCYLLPFGVILLWLLYESKKVKTTLLAALVLLSMVCMFFHEAFAPSRDIRGTAWWSIFLRERFCLSFACWDIFCTCFFAPAFLFTGRCGRASVFSFLEE